MPCKTKGGRGRESEYDAVDCLDWWRSQQGKNAKEAAQARSYESHAELNELKIAEKRGELVAAEKVILEGQTFVKAWTAKIRALPRQLVQAGVIPREREADVAAMLRALLVEVSAWRTSADAARATEAVA
jgi:hypothetical protein